MHKAGFSSKEMYDLIIQYIQCHAVKKYVSHIRICNHLHRIERSESFEYVVHMLGEGAGDTRFTGQW